MLDRLVLGVINGLVWALIVSIIAIGFVLIFGLLRITNLAHGEFYMSGAILTWFMVQWLGFSGFWVALPVLLLFFLGIGFLIERILFRPVEGGFMSTTVVSVGISYIIQQIALLTYGGIASRIEFPIAGSFQIVGFEYPVYRVFCAFISFLCLTGIWMFLYRTNYGLLIRASKQNKELARSMGINSTQVCMVTFGIGSALTAFSGALSTSIVPVMTTMGVDALIAAIIIVIVGGMESIMGTVVAALIISETEGVASAFIEPPEARLLSLAILIVVLLVRPSGLFGARKR